MPIDLTVNDNSSIPLSVENNNDTDFQHSEEYILAVSPTATVTQTENGAVITIRDKNGETVAVLLNGQDGATGPQGEQGPQGPPGEIDWSELDADRIEAALGFRPISLEPVTTMWRTIDNNLKSNYYKNYEVDSKFAEKTEVPTKVSDLTNDSGYLTEHQSLSGYATESWVNQQGFLTQHQSLADYALKAEVPTKVSELTNDSGYLNQHQDISGKLDKTETALRSASIPIGRCDSTSTATVFTASVPGITELRDGVCMWLENGVVTSASGFTINVNGLGAKPVYSSLAAATRQTTIFNVAYTCLFVYNSERVEGGCWDLVFGIDSNTNTIGYQIRHNSSTRPASDKGYRYRLWFTSADGTHYVPANKSSSTNATSSRTPNTTPIDPFGDIIYYGTNGTTNAGTNLTATGIWQQYSLSLGYSFNDTGAALTMTAHKPVYVKCTPQADGSAVLVGYTQDKPTTDDGFIYIYLGIAYSATNIELSLTHPVYWHDGTGVRLWTGTDIRQAQSKYTVTVSLTNPLHSSGFGNCAIEELLSTSDIDVGQRLGDINRADGTKTVFVDGVYGLLITVDGLSVGYVTSSMITCTGGVTLIRAGTTSMYQVTGDGTITIDGVDYDD